MRKRICVIGLVIILIASFCLGAKSCIGRNKGRRVGSSIDTEWRLNAPSNLSASAVSYSQINLSWSDNSNNEDGFEIERRTPSTGYSLIATLNQNAISYSDTGQLLLFNTYYYRVRAYNTIGDRSAYSNEAGVTISPPVWSEFVAGESYTIALTGSNTIWAWGNNSYYQLGLGENAPFTVTMPTLLGNDSDWSMIAAGFYHTLAMKTDRTLWTWGANDSGQLGLGTSGDNDPYRAEPTPIGNDSDWLMAACGSNHTLGIKTAGTLWSWGYNASGQLGLGYYGDIFDPDNPLNYVVTPTQIGTDSDWAYTTAGSAFSFALKTDNTLWSWGWNDSGQLGGGGNNKPGKIGTASDWSAVTAGYAHTIALKTDATLWAWGSGYTSTPTKIVTDTDWSKITSGGATPSSDYSLAIKTNGLFWAWGQNGSGQLGLGDYTIRESPTQIGISTDWISATAGGYHVIARDNNGELWLWGRNNFGQLGFGNTVNQNMPINLNRPQPGALIATIVSPSQIDISWTDNSFNETGFKLERSLDGVTYTLIVTLPADTTSYSDTNINTMNTYYYRAKTIYNEIDSSNSNTVEALNIRWSQQTSAGAPLRSGHAAVWDPDGEKMIIFSGADDVDYQNDLWWYEPVSDTWTQKIASGMPGSPSPRWGHSMVWDPIGERVIMFGGRDLSVFKNDLWEYSPLSNTWTVITPTGVLPFARMITAMVWDPIGERVVMFGGAPEFVGLQNDLWWYDPELNKWSEKNPGGPPLPRSGHSMVWDLAGQRIILFGGTDDSSFPLNDLWWLW